MCLILVYIESVFLFPYTKLLSLHVHNNQLYAHPLYTRNTTQQQTTVNFVQRKYFLADVCLDWIFLNFNVQFSIAQMLVSIVRCMRELVYMYPKSYGPQIVITQTSIVEHYKSFFWKSKMFLKKQDLNWECKSLLIFWDPRLNRYTTISRMVTWFI